MRTQQAQEGHSNCCAAPFRCSQSMKFGAVVIVAWAGVLAVESLLVCTWLLGFSFITSFAVQAVVSGVRDVCLHSHVWFVSCEFLCVHVSVCACAYDVHVSVHECKHSLLCFF